MNAIKQKRDEKGLTQAQLGRVVGVDQSYIARVEVGHVTPNDLAERIADALDCEVGDIFQLHQPNKRWVVK